VTEAGAAEVVSASGAAATAPEVTAGDAAAETAAGAEESLTGLAGPVSGPAAEYSANAEGLADCGDPSFCPRGVGLCAGLGS
jgi:hypothetical protein